MPTTVGCPSGGCSSPAARASSSLSMAGSSSVTSPEASCCSSACARCSSSGSAATGAGPNLEGVFETPPPACVCSERSTERAGGSCRWRKGIVGAHLQRWLEHRWHRPLRDELRQADRPRRELMKRRLAADATTNGARCKPPTCVSTGPVAARNPGDGGSCCKSLRRKAASRRAEHASHGRQVRSSLLTCTRATSRARSRWRRRRPARRPRGTAGRAARSPTPGRCRAAPRPR